MEIARELQQKIMERLDLSVELSDDALLEHIDLAVLDAGKQCHLSVEQRLLLRKQIFDSFRRLDVLQELMEDDSVTEIMVNGMGSIFLERGGVLYPWDRHFDSEEKLNDVIQQIVSRVNRVVNTSHPIVDARLLDGSRVHVVLPPVAPEGPIMTIRKFSKEAITMAELIAWGSITEDAAALLKGLVKAGYNIFVSGGTGTGKTTFLNALSCFIPSEDRVITIEDSLELQLPLRNLVRLEARPANLEGEQEISIRDLIRASLRMRPTRIIVGEVRGAEALDMLQAMNTGHDGSLSTGHGNSPSDMLSRLETMVLVGADLPLEAIRGQIASALDILVHLIRCRDGSRCVESIQEVTGYENGRIVLSPLYERKPREDGGFFLCKRNPLRCRGKWNTAGLPEL